jgi:hypothetical protein
VITCVQCPCRGCYYGSGFICNCMCILADPGCLDVNTCR